MHFACTHGRVEILDVSESEEFKIAVAGIHLLDHPFKRLRGLLRIGDDRGQQMRYARVSGQFHSFRINHDHAHLVRRRPHDHRCQHGVDETGLARTGGACHQKMRHLGEVGRYKMTFHILAHACEHRVRIIPCLVRTKHVAKHHGFTVGVRYFDADGRLAFDHRQDAHVGAGHRVGNVFLQIGDLLHFHARTKLHLVHGYGWTAQEADDFGIDVELLEGDRKRANHTIVLRRVHGVRCALLQHAEVR